MNIQMLMQQAQQMQKQVQAKVKEAKESLSNQFVSSEAGGGLVKVTMNGRFVVQKIEINPDAVDPEETDLLEDLIAAAMNDAARQAEALSDKVMGEATGGMGLPPGMGGLF